MTHRAHGPARRRHGRGGQLARMTHQAAISLGLSLRVLADDPGRRRRPRHAGGGDRGRRRREALERFAKGCDVVTFDHEHVPQAVLLGLGAQRGRGLLPAPTALRFAQDKRAMRRGSVSSGSRCPPGRTTPTSLPRPYVAKAVTRRVRRSRRLVRRARATRCPTSTSSSRSACRSFTSSRSRSRVPRRARIRSWPVVETVQRDGICVEVVAPAPRLSPTLADEAEQLAVTIANELDVVGVMAVELFEAPERPGRQRARDAAAQLGALVDRGQRTTSQFQQHLRAVLDWPLGDTRPRAPVSVMVNLLGGDAPTSRRRCPRRSARYRTRRSTSTASETRPGRKLGHVTVLGDDVVGDPGARTARGRGPCEGRPT